MRLYHSSNVSVERPDTEHSRPYLDFGRGFYLTSLYEQAVKYAQRFKEEGNLHGSTLMNLSLTKHFGV